MSDRVARFISKHYPKYSKNQDLHDTLTSEYLDALCDFDGRGNIDGFVKSRMRYGANKFIKGKQSKPLSDMPVISVYDDLIEVIQAALTKQEFEILTSVVLENKSIRFLSDQMNMTKFRVARTYENAINKLRRMKLV